jgi:hypothetical protein
LTVLPTARRDESQGLYCHRRCLRERLVSTVPRHPDLEEDESEGSASAGSTPTRSLRSLIVVFGSVSLALATAAVVEVRWWYLGGSGSFWGRLVPFCGPIAILLAATGLVVALFAKELRLSLLAVTLATVLGFVWIVEMASGV